MSFNSDMRTILALDRYATVKLTTFADPWAWYVEARIEISDGWSLTALASHAATPSASVRGFVKRLHAVAIGGAEYIIVRDLDSNRRVYQWDDGMFVAVTQPGLLRR